MHFFFRVAGVDVRLHEGPFLRRKKNPVSGEHPLACPGRGVLAPDSARAKDRPTKRKLSKPQERHK